MYSYKHILVPIDFSDRSKAAARQAIDLAEHYNAKLTFLHIVEHFPEHLPHYEMSEVNMDPEEFVIDRAGKDLQELATRLGKEDVGREVRLTTHSAKGEIVSYAKGNDVDLVVLGARGRETLTDMLSGSTATGVVRAAPCDVLAVHRTDTEAD